MYLFCSLSPFRPVDFYGVRRDRGQVAPNPGSSPVVRVAGYSPVLRVLRAQEEAASAADVLRLAQPEDFSGALDKVRSTFDSESAEEGIEFV